ncbi:hypothetical protein D9M69_218710 [compost metagenome]
MSKIMSAVVPSCLSSPFTQVRRVSFDGSGTSAVSTIHGPTGVVASRFFTRRLGR